MSTFKCEVVRLKIEPHPNADAIEIARIGDYQSIVKKGQFQDGDLGVYIPEQAVLPEWLLKEMGFWQEDRQKGALSGAAGNRVKAIKLRGVLSQGIVVALEDGVTLRYPEREDGAFAHNCLEGQDVAEFLGIVKYEPALPSHMRCRVAGVDYANTHNYDFDNLKKTPTLFDDGEEVVITEKIHGTLIQIGVVPSSAANEKYYKGRVVISSKGMGAKGYVLDHTDETNLYAQAAIKHGLLDKVLEVFGPAVDSFERPVFVLGEVFGKTNDGGKGIQDLTYTGLPLDLRIFDICVGNRGNEQYYCWDSFAQFVNELGVYHVPLLYRGPYSKDVVLQHTDGNTTLMAPGNKPQIREGCVVKSAWEHRHPHFGRKIAKSVSSAYLLRKGETTEFN